MPVAPLMIEVTMCSSIAGCNKITMCHMTRNTSDICIASNCTVTSSGVGGGVAGVE